MKAKVVKGFNSDNPNKDCWMIMVKPKDGNRYNKGLLVDGKPYFTYHQEEAKEKVRRINN